MKGEAGEGGEKCHGRGGLIGMCVSPRSLSGGVKTGNCWQSQEKVRVGR